MNIDASRITLDTVLKLSKVYHDLKSRCTDKNHPFWRYYGGRGINLCRAWKKNQMRFILWCFRNGWKAELEIDRKVNDRGYYPSNCRFVTHQRNMANRGHDDMSGFAGRRYKLPMNISMHNGKLRVCVIREGIKVSKTGFKTVDEAVIVRDKLIKELEEKVYGES